MVHALQEAQRVLKSNGILIDLRPAAVHRRVGVARAGRIHPLGTMRERLDDDYAANRAVAEVIRGGLFRSETRVRFNCNRVMDTLNEFRVWIADFVSLGRLPSHDWLVARVERALHARRRATKIVVRAPLDLRVLRKRQSLP